MMGIKDAIKKLICNCIDECDIEELYMERELVWGAVEKDCWKLCMPGEHIKINISLTRGSGTKDNSYLLELARSVDPPRKQSDNDK